MAKKGFNVFDKTKDTVTSDDGVYVINYDGELFVKQVQKQLDGLALSLQTTRTIEI